MWLLSRGVKIEIQVDSLLSALLLRTCLIFSFSNEDLQYIPYL